MNLKQMRYFVAVATERNFTRAAKRLHMAQPPLTRHMAELERDLGAPLFVRTPKGVELTEAGAALLDEVPNILSLTERAHERARRAGQGLTGTLEIGVFGSGILSVIPRILAILHAERPDVEIRLHNLTKPEQLEALRERRITAGFHRLPPDDPDIDAQLVTREPLYVGMHESHPLARRDRLRAADLHDQPMILYPNLDMPGLEERVARMFNRENVALRVVQQVEDVLTCVALVAGRFGLCVTPRSAADNLLLPGVAYRPLDSAFLPDVELSCAYLRGNRSPALLAMLEVIERYRRDNGPA
ncbi:HTH-type transcriptional regulator BenM [Pigmentiphaga humi]|uniref:HTH-type transcriptional regulator BenM n=1 Tax=Pigmentiphaga humi TaxID=2478468 RepID=A0A3P4B0A6_9BURK|nr:LysR family transcriptional regulator [Pigmentiphaga humi]VCU69160.1 HTH-type transcriptional regulator BenM [Pigmentiphaga humi]